MSSMCCLCSACAGCCYCCCPCCFKTVASGKSTYIPLDGESTPRPKREFRWCCALIASVVFLGLFVAIFYPVLNFGIIPPIGKKMIKNGKIKLKTFDLNLGQSSVAKMEVATTVRLQLTGNPPSPIPLKAGYTTVQVKNQNNQEFAEIYLNPFKIPAGKDPEIMVNSKFRLTNLGNTFDLVWGLFTGNGKVKADLNPRVKGLGNYVNAKVMGHKDLPLPHLDLKSLAAKLLGPLPVAQLSAGPNTGCAGMGPGCKTYSGTLTLNAQANFGDVQMQFGKATFHIYRSKADRVRGPLLGRFETTNFGLKKDISSCTAGNKLSVDGAAIGAKNLYIEGPVHFLNYTHPVDGRPAYFWNTSVLQIK